MPMFIKHGFQKLLQAFYVLLLVTFVGSVFISTVSRYAFSLGSVRLEDFISYMFSALVILSVLIAFQKNKHVKVQAFSIMHDFFEGRFLRILSAIPFLIIAVLSLPAVSFSWAIFEGSKELAGLGGVFIIKTLLPISFVLIAVYLCFGGKDKQS